MSHIGRSFVLVAVVLIAVAFMTATEQGRQFTAQLSASVSSMTADLFGK